MHFPIYGFLAIFYVLSEVAAGHSSLANSHARRSIDVKRQLDLAAALGGVVGDAGNLLGLNGASPSSSSSSISDTSTDTSTSSTPSSSAPPVSTTDATSSPSSSDPTVTPASSSTSSDGGLLGSVVAGLTTAVGDVTSILSPSSTSLPDSTSSSAPTPGPTTDSTSSSAPTPDPTSDSGTPTSASTPAASSTTGGLLDPLTTILNSVLPGTTTQASSDTPTTDPTIPSSTPSSSPTTGIPDPLTSVVDTAIGSVTSALNSVTSALIPPTTTQAPPDTPTVAPTVPPTVSSSDPLSTGDPLATVTGIISSAASPVTSILLPATTTQAPVDTQTVPPTILPSSPSSSDGGLLSTAIPAITSTLPGTTSILPPSTDEPPVSLSASGTVQTLVSATDTAPTPVSATDTVPTPLSATPMLTSDSAVSSPPIITFPNPLNSTAPVVDPSVTIPSTSIVATTTISVDPGLSFILTETSLAVAPTPTTTDGGTLTDPDQVTTTELVPTESTAATTLSVAPLPTGIPARIYPRDEVDTTGLAGYTLISILFNQELNWAFVVSNTVSSSQIFAYVPVLITTALGITSDQVKTWALQVYVPTTYHTPADSVELGTMWLGYIPTQYVDTLAAEIKAKQSKFYTGVPDNVAQSLANRVNSGFSLLSVADPNSSVDGGSGTTVTGGAGNNNSARQDAIIGVVSALGAIAVLVLVFLVYRSMKRRQQLAHHRLSDPPGLQDLAGMRPEGREFDQDSVGGARRRSFYYAEDSLRGYQEQREADEVFDITTERRTTPQMIQRRAVVPGAISAPVLRESSMNW